MILKPLRARLLAVAGLLTPLSAVPAVASDAAAPVFAPVVAPCPSGCPPVAYAPAVGCTGCTTVGPVLGGYTGLGGSGTGVGLFANNPPWWRKRQMIDGQNQPACAVNSFPLSDWAYIRRYCRPTIIPGTCYGHFQTTWRKWEDHCPQQAAGGVGCDPFAGGAVYPAPAMPVFQVPPAYSAPSQPLPAPTRQPTTEPKKPEVAPKPMPVPKPDTDDAPKKPKTTDDTGGLPMPELPEIPLALPSRLK